MRLTPSIGSGPNDLAGFPREKFFPPYFRWDLPVWREVASGVPSARGRRRAPTHAHPPVIMPLGAVPLPRGAVPKRPDSALALVHEILAGWQPQMCDMAKRRAMSEIHAVTRVRIFRRAPPRVTGRGARRAGLRYGSRPFSALCSDSVWRVLTGGARTIV